MQEERKESKSNYEKNLTTEEKGWFTDCASEKKKKKECTARASSTALNQGYEFL